MPIKRITYTHRKGGSRIIDQEGKEMSSKTPETKALDKKLKKNKEVNHADT